MITRLLSAALLTLGGAAAAADDALPPSPVRIVKPSLLRPPALDPVPLCLPETDDARLSAAAGLARTGDEAAARESLERIPGAEVDPSAALILALRIADTPKRRAQAIDAASGRPSDDIDPALRICLLVERARAQLRNGMAPEASASAYRAGRWLDEGADQGAVAASLRYLRAEALVLGRRDSDARPLVEALRQASEPKIAKAARLRWIDLEADSLAPDAAWTRFRLRLEEARDGGLDIRGWELRAAELAIAAGDLRRAQLWLSVAADLRGDPLWTGLASIRKADVLVATGRRDEAHRILTRVQTDEGPDAVRALASIRELEYGLVTVDADGLVERLQRLGAGNHLGVSIYARGLLLHALVERGELGAALDEFSRLSHDAPAPELVPHVSSDADAIAAGAAGADCRDAVERIGARRTVLLQMATRPEPFLHLGDCLVQIGLAEAAAESYRAATRRFGPELASQLPLRMARAALESGELPEVRASIRARAAQRGTPVAHAPALPGDSWELVEADFAWTEGRSDDATRLLTPLVRMARAPADRALRLARLAVRSEPDPVVLGALADWVDTMLPRSPEDPATRELVGEVVLRVADLHHRIGDRARAERRYDQAIEWLPDGPSRARARYRSALLADGPQAMEEGLRELVATSGKSAWDRLARVEVRMSDLRADIGLSASVAAPSVQAPASPAGPELDADAQWGPEPDVEADAASGPELDTEADAASGTDLDAEDDAASDLAADVEAEGEAEAPVDESAPFEEIDSVGDDE